MVSQSLPTCECGGKQGRLTGCVGDREREKESHTLGPSDKVSLCWNLNTEQTYRATLEPGVMKNEKLNKIL